MFILGLEFVTFLLLTCQVAIFWAVRQAPPPAPVRDGGGSMLGGIGSTIAQGGIVIQSLSYKCYNNPTNINLNILLGMAFGTGSAMAHRAVDSLMGPRTIQHETVVSEAAATAPAAPMMNADACNIHSKAFQDVCFLATLCCLY